MSFPKPNEVASLGEASKNLTRIFDRLDAGEAPHVFVIGGNRVRGVVLSHERYAELLDAASSLNAVMVAGGTSAAAEGKLRVTDTPGGVIVEGSSSAA